MYDLFKHSKRTLRGGCEKCGEKQLYWAHDTTRSGRHCDDCNVSYGWVLIEADEIGSDANVGQFADFTVHVCGKPVKSRPFGFSGSKDEAEAAPVAALPAPAPQGGSDAGYAAFQTLIASMAPQVDRAQVEAMIKEQLANVVFPTKTVVERANGEVKEITGAHSKLADVTTDLLAGEHVLMVGPAGTGKSTIAEQAAEALGLKFYSISLSPMTPASQILGYMQAEGEYVRSLYREAFEHGGVFHFDEFDNAHPSVLAVINASLANGQMAFPDQMVKRHPDFRCVASANTYGRGPDRQYVGRQQIDAATLDRFSVETIEVDEALETQLCMATGLVEGTVNRVLDYVRKLRRNAETKGMTVVVSPRASVGMCRLIAAGKPWEAAVESRVRRGMSDKDWGKLTSTY